MQPTAYFHEVLLGCTCAFMHCLWLLSYRMMESLQNRLYGPKSLKYLLSGPVQEEIIGPYVTDLFCLLYEI